MEDRLLMVSKTGRLRELMCWWICICWIWLVTPCESYMIWQISKPTFTERVSSFENDLTLDVPVQMEGIMSIESSNLSRSLMYESDSTPVSKLTFIERIARFEWSTIHDP